MVCAAKQCSKLLEIRHILCNVVHNVQSEIMHTDINNVQESSQSKTEKASKGD